MLSVRGQDGNNSGGENDRDPYRERLPEDLVEILGLEVVDTTRRNSSTIGRCVYRTHRIEELRGIVRD